jgi:hypothetical protein
MTATVANHFTAEMAKMIANTAELDRLLKAEARERRRREMLEFLGDVPKTTRERDILADFIPRDLWIDRTHDLIRMAATPANAFTDNMTSLTGNSGGAVETLPAVTVFGGKERVQFGRITLASQSHSTPTIFGVFRVPLYAALVWIGVSTDTSLGSSTLAFGDAADGNGAIYGAAATFTSTNTETRGGPKTATLGMPITSGYDCVTAALVSPFMPQTAGQGGFSYEDIIATVGAADLPSSGNLVLICRYAID